MDANDPRNQIQQGTGVDDTNQGVGSESIGTAGGLGMDLDALQPTASAQTPGPIPAGTTPTDVKALEEQARHLQEELERLTSAITQIQHPADADAFTSVAPVSETPAAKPEPLSSLQSETPAGPLTTFERLKQLQQEGAVSEPLVDTAPEINTATPSTEKELRDAVSDPAATKDPIRVPESEQPAISPSASEPETPPTPDPIDLVPVAQNTQDPIDLVDSLTTPTASAAPESFITEAGVEFDQPDNVITASEMTEPEDAQRALESELRPSNIEPSSILKSVRTLQGDLAEAKNAEQQPEINPAPAGETADPVAVAPHSPSIDTSSEQTQTEPAPVHGSKEQPKQTVDQLKNVTNESATAPGNGPNPKNPDGLSSLKTKMDVESTHQDKQSEPSRVRDMFALPQDTPQSAIHVDQPIAAGIKDQPFPDAVPEVDLDAKKPTPTIAIQETTPAPVAQTAPVAPAPQIIDVPEPSSQTPQATIMEEHVVNDPTAKGQPLYVSDSETPIENGDHEASKSFFDKLSVLRNSGNVEEAPRVPASMPGAMSGVAAPAEELSTMNDAAAPVVTAPASMPGPKVKTMDELLNDATGTPKPPTPQAAQEPIAPATTSPIPATPDVAAPPPQRATPRMAAQTPSTSAGGAEPFSPTTQTQGRLSSVRTYKDDLARTVSHKETSLVNVISKDQERQAKISQAKERAKPIQSGGVGTFVKIGISGLLVGVGIAIAVFAIYIQGTVPEPVPVVSIPEYVFTEEQLPIDLTDATNDNVMRKLLTAKDGVQLELGELAHLYLITQQFIPEQGQVTQNVTPEEFFRLLRARTPTSLTRNLNDFMMFGAHYFDSKNHAYTIFKTSSYDFSFGGMLEWEQTMNADLAPLFGPVSLGRLSAKASTTASSTDATASTTASTTPETDPSRSSDDFFQNDFEDEIVRNHDVRVLRDINDEIVLLYGFPDTGTLVITTNEHTFAQIASRLSDRRF